MPTFRTTRRVEFRDTDAAGIMHFSTFFIKMEEVEHEFLRSLGHSVVMHDEAGELISWPRVAAHCEYHGAVRFEQTLDIELSVGRLGDTSLTYHFQFQHQGRLIASGYVTCVCCRLVQHGRPQPIPIPTKLRAGLQPYVTSSSAEAKDASTP